MNRNSWSYRFFLAALLYGFAFPQWAVAQYWPPNDCHPLTLISCTLPFPSNSYGRPDPGSATGLRLGKVDFWGAEVIDQLGPGTPDPNRFFIGNSGFSPVSPAMFEFDQPFDGEQLAVRTDAVIVALDLTSGEAVAVHAQVSLVANLMPGRRLDTNVLEVWPRGRWQFGHTYVVAVTRNLQPELGPLADKPQPMTPAAGILALEQGSDRRLSNYYARALEALASQGYKPENLLTFTEFTVRSEAEVTEPLLALAQQVYAADHPIRNLRVRRSRLPRATAALVTGEVLLTSFRDAGNGGLFNLFDVENASQGEDYWARFVLYLPRQAALESVPVVLFGHGIGFRKEVNLPNARLYNEQGVALLAIDQPNHGTRAQVDGGRVFSLATPQELMRLQGFLAQSPLDFIALEKAVKQSFSGFDWVSRPGITVPDLNTQQLYYTGTSLGGVLGATYMALSPAVNAGYLQVPGVGIQKILSSSMFWPLVFSSTLPQNVSGAQAAVLFSTLQQLFDYADSLNFLQYYRKPWPGKRTMSLALQYGIGDALVPNIATDSMLLVADIPLINPLLSPLDYLPLPVDALESGWGARQVLWLEAVREVPEDFSTTGLLGLGHSYQHLSFFAPAALEFQRQWTQEVIFANEN